MGKQQKAAPSNRKAEKAKAGKRSGNVRKSQTSSHALRGTPQELTALSNVIILEQKIASAIKQLHAAVKMDTAPDLSFEAYNQAIQLLARGESMIAGTGLGALPLYERQWFMSKTEGLFKLGRAWKLQADKAGKLVQHDAA